MEPQNRVPSPEQAPQQTAPNAQQHAPPQGRAPAAGATGNTDTIVLRINRSELRRGSKDSANSLELDSDAITRRLGEFLLLKTGVSPCSSRGGSRSGSPLHVRPGDGSPIASTNRRRSRQVSGSATPVPANEAPWPELSFSNDESNEETDTEDHEPRERRKEKSRLSRSRKSGPKLILDASQPVEDDCDLDLENEGMNKKRHMGRGLSRRALPEPLAAQDVADMMEGMTGLGEPLQVVGRN